jgi:hypothetical protein
MVANGEHDGRKDGETAASGSSRRRWLALCGAAVIPGLAGCSGGGGDATEPGTQSGTEAGMGSESGAEESTDGGDSTASDGGQPFSETIRYEESFAMEGTVQNENGEMQMQGRFADGDVYWRIERTDGQVSEMYTVDGEQYFVTDGRCMMGSSSSPGSEAPGVAQFEEDTSSQPELVPAGRETIDGEEFLVYEVSPESGETRTYYVDPETGHPRRIESPSATIDYHSWGDVDPVQAPDMDCQEMGAMTPSG